MRPLLIPLACLLLQSWLHAQTDWLTDFERSEGTRTPRYRETLAYCRRLADASPRVHLEFFGISPQGRGLPVVVVDRDGFTDPDSVKSTGRLILLIQACIHPGESDGKDAGLMLVRDLVTPPPGPSPEGEGRKSPSELVPRTREDLGVLQHPASGIRDLLEHVSLLFIPIFNVDGHERFGPYNRINQNGPEEMGWRVTARNLNLNRDFLKADASEMKDWLTLYNRWDPDFFIDIHTTDGADYQYVLTYMMETLGQMDPGLTTWCNSVFLPAWTSGMEAAGYPVFPYVEFRTWHNPKSGLERNIAPPMLSQGYVALRNRPGLLVETHMLKPYKQRVEATYECLVTALEILNQQHAEVKRLNRAADDQVSSPTFRTTPFPLKFSLSSADSTMIPFCGFRYDTIRSEVTGGLWYRYGADPETFTVPLFESSLPEEVVTVPQAYVIPAEWQDVIEILTLHGVRMRVLDHDSLITVTSYKFSDPKWRSTPYEGRHPLVGFEIVSLTEEREFPRGSVLIETSQPTARVILHLLEPRGDGSLLSWGFFDPIFEQKEYFEFYVMEPLARKMLDEDPVLRDAFEKQKASDSNWIKNQWQVLNWFLDHTPYADTRKMVYPVGRVE